MLRKVVSPLKVKACGSRSEEGCHARNQGARQQNEDLFMAAVRWWGWLKAGRDGAEVLVKR
jgi:hypothetical protein